MAEDGVVREESFTVQFGLLLKNSPGNRTGKENHHLLGAPQVGRSIDLKRQFSQVLSRSEFLTFAGRLV
ncbi:hypothetical protein R1flu_023649 [Riccia fluitans]|uniref:Uncharacterized protein n=1 Tax=Riccia fluitans TaxID=41844 RepID=A0ABD1XSM1_9MARC